MSALTEPNSRQTGAAAAFVDDQLKVGRVGFPLSQLMDRTGLSPAAAKGQLRRLGSSVVRVTPAHPFFLIVAPEHQSTGGPPVDWWIDDYFAWLGRPYYLGLQSAASALGSSPQSIQVTQVMTDTPRRPVEIGRLKIAFFVKRRIERTATQQLPGAFAPAFISTPAATVFDLIRYAPRIGGIGRAVDSIRPLLAKVEAPQLREVLGMEDRVATSQRLGYILEKSGHARLADVVGKWLPAKRPLTALIPSRPSRPGAPVDERWRVLDNSGEFGP